MTGCIGGVDREVGRAVFFNEWVVDDWAELQGLISR